MVYCQTLVGLLNTYLPLTVIVFVINVKWFTVTTSRSAFVQVVGLLNTYLPLTVMVFVINVKGFTTCMGPESITSNFVILTCVYIMKPYLYGPSLSLEPECTELDLSECGTISGLFRVTNILLEYSI